MRSRNGSFAILFRFCTLVFLNTFILNASEYLISYRFIVKDAILYNESLQISHAMTKCQGSVQKTLLLESNGKKNLQNIVSLNHEKFISFINSIGLNISHKESTINLKNHSTTILTLPTTCFKVDFNDNFAKISSLK